MWPIISKWASKPNTSSTGCAEPRERRAIGEGETGIRVAEENGLGFVPEILRDAMDRHGSAIDRAVEQCKNCGGLVVAHVVAQARDHFVEHEIGRYDQGAEVDQSPEVRVAGLMVLIGRSQDG